MSRWKRVKWTEAAQVSDLLDWPELEDGLGKQSPEDFFTHLRDQNRLYEAAQFLGQALPRYDAVAWAARTVRDTKPVKPKKDTARAALKAALLWLQDSSDHRRRAAFAAASDAPTESAERLVALATFLSGGSMAPENCQPVPAPKDAAGRIAAAAVILAAKYSGEATATLTRALDLGDAIASGRAEAS